MCAVRARVAQGKWRADQQSPSWVGYAILEALGITDRGTAAKAKAKALQAMWIQSKALEEYQDEDERRRRKMFVRPGPFND